MESNVNKHDVVADVERMREGDRAVFGNAGAGAMVEVVRRADGFVVECDGQVEAEGCDVSVAADVVVEMVNGDPVIDTWNNVVKEWTAIVRSCPNIVAFRESFVREMVRRFDGVWDDETGTGHYAGQIRVGEAIITVDTGQVALFDNADDAMIDPPVREVHDDEVVA